MAKLGRKYILVATAVIALIALPGVLYAAAQTFTLQPGDTLHVTCSTTLTGTVGSSSADLKCAAPTASLAWISPTGVRDVRKSVGYTQYCDWNGCGTSPPSYAFDCSGHQMLGRDDEDTEGTVGFAAPLQISGVDFWTKDGFEPPGTRMFFDFYGATVDSFGSEHPAYPGSTYTHIGPQLVATFPAPALAPADNHLRHLHATFAPVTVSYLAWYMDGQGTWPSLWGLRLQVPASTPGKTC